jgi:hypothetical protein
MTAKTWRKSKCNMLNQHCYQVKAVDGAISRGHYTFLRVLKKVLREMGSLASLVLCLPTASQAQNSLPAPTGFRLSSADGAIIHSQPVTLRVLGKCDYSEDGITFTNLEPGHVLKQGTVLRTGEDSWADLFFRRTGTTLRLRAGTEIRLDRLAITLKGRLVSVHTVLNLRRGTIFTMFRSAVADDTLEIWNAGGRSVVEGCGVGNYIMTAEGTYITAIGSIIPLKMVGENGTAIIAAGQQFNQQDGKIHPVARTKDLVQMDQFIAGRPSPEP